METILFGRGIVTRAQLLSYINHRKYLIVADREVYSLYEDIFYGLNVFKAPPGEAAKTYENYIEMVTACNISYITRGGVIIAVGGGALLDAAGFLASTYMRGVSVIKVPTTIIAMCDAAIGGKNAINSNSAKNEIGTFYSAEMIVEDVEFLRTLPVNEIRAGLGEILKYAVGFAPEMLNTLKTLKLDDHEALLSLIKKSAGIKQKIVEADFKEGNIRKCLNFGHTLGHAIEFASKFEVSHGNAVAIGVRHMVNWAHRDAKISDAEMDLIRDCYENLGLPWRIPENLNKNVVFSYVLSDKKMVGSDIDLVKLASLGSTEIVRCTLDAFYDEVFKKPLPRVRMEDKWRMGIGERRIFDGNTVHTVNGSVDDSAAAFDCSGAVFGAAPQGASNVFSANSSKNSSGSSPDGTAKSMGASGRPAVIHLPVSKSYAHRFLILAAFAEVPTVIERFDLSDDIDSTINALKAISGAKFDFKESELVVVPKKCIIGDTSAGDTARLNALSSSASKRIDVDCGSSASTARFLIPFSNINTTGVTYFYGSSSLENRPMNGILNVLKAQGILAGESYTKSLPFGVKDRLKPGVFRIPGDTTSQTLSGLLMAGPKMNGRSRIIVTGEQVSRPYVDITIDAMRRMGVEVQADSKGSRRGRKDGEELVYHISPANYYAKGKITVEKDYSQAAFWLVAELLRQLHGGNFRQIVLPGLNPNSLQGDRAILDILGVRIEPNGEIRCVKDPMREVDLTHYPDLFPILSVFYALYEKGGIIAGADRVSYKESDRYEAMKLELTRLGCRVARENGKFRIYPSKLVGKPVSAHEDHRVAMSLLILGLFVDGVRLDGTESISKSYPMFVEDLRRVLE